MARTYEELVADELKAEAATTAPPAVIPAPAPIGAAKPGSRLQSAIKPAAPPAPPVTRAVEPVKPKPQEIKAPKEVKVPKEAKAPEAAAPVPPPKLVLPPDVARDIDYKKVYDAAGTPFVSQALRFAAPEMGMSADELQRVAQAQGVDLDAIVKGRNKGRTYDEIVKAARDRGVIGFMPIEERERAFTKLADDVEKAQKGIASDTVELKRAGADKGFGPAGALSGYTFAGTQAELPEVTKPGEHAYTVASLLVDAILKDKSASQIYDLYGRKLATGNTQRYIDERTEQLRGRANIKASDPDAVEKIAALRRRATNEVIAFKTVGMWTPIVTMQDVDVTEGRAEPGLLGSVMPNIEIIGFNNKGQAIFRQESPLGVLFRAIDVPQSAVVGALSGVGAARGIQTGANFLEYALDTTEGSAPYVRAPAIAAGFAASLVTPDLLGGAGVAASAAKAAYKTRVLGTNAKRGIELLDTIMEARAAGNAGRVGEFKRATDAEVALRREIPAAADLLDRADARAAEMMDIVEPMPDNMQDDLAAVIASRVPAAADMAASRAFLHPSVRKDVLGVVTKTKEYNPVAYDTLYNTKRQLDSLAEAKAEYLAAEAKTVEDYVTSFTRGVVRDGLSAMPEALRPSAEEIDELAELVARATPTGVADKKAFLETELPKILKEGKFADDKYKAARQAVYRRNAQIGRMLDRVKGRELGELMAEDLGLFERAQRAILRNSEARGVAASLIRDELAAAGRIKIQPSNLFASVSPKLPDGTPYNLTPDGVILFAALRRAAPQISAQDAYAAAAVFDAMAVAEAKRLRVSVEDIYKSRAPQIRSATPEDLKRVAGAKGGPPAPAAPAAAEVAPVATAPTPRRRAARPPKAEAPPVEAPKAEAPVATLTDLADEELDNAILALEEGPPGPMLDELRAEKARRAAPAVEAPTPTVTAETWEGARVSDPMAGKSGVVVRWEPLGSGMNDALVRYDDGKEVWTSSNMLRAEDGAARPTRMQAQRAADEKALADLKAIRERHLAGLAVKWPGMEFGKAHVGQSIDQAIADVEARLARAEAPTPPTPTVAAPAAPTVIPAATEAQAEAAKIVETAPATRGRAARAKKAEAAQTKLFPSIVPLARSAPSPWGDTPKRFVVAAESRLRKAGEDLDARLIDQVEYDIAVGDVKRDLAAQKAERAVKKSQAQLVRGADDARAKLLQAKAAGVIDEAGADLAEWLIRQNPRIADDLNIAVLTAESAKKRFGVQIGEEVAGFYEPVDRVVALIKERGSELTAAHEILHHTEQMLPEALQTAVVDEWAKQIQKALGTATPEQRPALEKALAGDSAALLTGVTDGTLPRSFYQYSNPSEFWAVNASRIVSGRYATADKGFVAKAKQWLTEFVEKVKSIFGLSSDAPLIRALDDVLKGNGTAVSNMLSEGAQLQVQRSASAILDELKKTQFISTPQLLQILGDSRPEYLDNVASFILEQRNKVREGRLTVRDVAKAYLPTVASQRAGAIDATRVEAILGPLDDRFIVLGKKGQRQVRPEEAMAAWMFSPDGQRALDALERGEFDADAWETVAKLRDIWGNNTLRNSGVFSVPKPGAATMQSLQSVVDEINAAGGDVTKVEAAVRKLNGIGNAKTPFISHLLGFGESPTMDAVEFNGWLTGRADIGTLATPESDLARDLKARQDVDKIAVAMADRAMGRFRALRAEGVPGTDLPDEVFGAIMHHWFWDKLKDAQTTHAGMYDALRYASKEAPMPSGISAAAERQTDVLKQVSPSGEVKGFTDWNKENRAIITLFEGADASTVLHEVAHVVRRQSLTAEDMDAITGWITSKGVKVTHQYGEFVGDADEIEKAEEMFAKAFERYVAEGVAPVPALTPVFEHLKQVILSVYKAVKDPIIGVELQPEVRAVFDRLFEGADQQANPTFKQVLRRSLLGAEDAGEEGVLTTLANEAKRRRIPIILDDAGTLGPSDVEDLQRQFDAAVDKKVADDKPYLRFPVPVMGKQDWTRNDIIELQAKRTADHLKQLERTRGIRIDLSRRGAGSAAMVEEDTAVETLRSWLSPRATEEEAGTPAKVRATLRGIAATFLGGDVVRERGGAQNLLRLAPPQFRKAIDTSARLIEQMLGEAIGLMNDTIETGNDTELVAFLSGKGDIRRLSGRPVVTAGHDSMASVIRILKNAFAQCQPDELAALSVSADAVNLGGAKAMDELASLGFGEGAFKAADEARARTQKSLATAINRILYAQSKGAESDFGASLAAALRGSVEAPGSPRPTHEVRLMEVLTYLAGVSARDGKTFSGTSPDAVRIFLNDIGNIYDDMAKRRAAISVIAGFGSADLAKDVLVKMDLAISPEAYRQFVGWTSAKTIDPKYVNELARVTNAYGANVEFIQDAVLDVNYYIPRLARERMAEALARATYRPAEAATGTDAFNMLYRYMKTRMTRGSFFVRPRYFMMNTTDHFMQMGMTVGFGVAAVSTTRVIAQDLVVVPGWAQVVDIVRLTPIGKRVRPDALEGVRRALQAGGDRAAWRVGQLFSVGKYRIEVNPILEGLDGGFRAGDKVYSYRDVRNIFVQEGVFSSYDTRELANVIQREGQLSIRTQLGNAELKAAGGSVVPARIRNFFADWQKSVADIAEAWGERERVGAAVSLMEAGYDPRTAARLTIDALYDYSQSLTKADRGLIVGIMFPFWAFQKNANMQVVNLMFSPWGAYRMMALKRAKDRTAQLLSEVLYNDVGTEYGLDVKSMPPELQDSYYAIIKEFEESYGADGPPPEAKRAMRLLLTGRAMGVESGVFTEVSANLQRLRGVGAFAEIQRFGEYAALEPSASNLPTYLRDRTGVPVPFPRTEAVRMYYRIAGDDHSYMELFWPESAVESGMRHHTQLMAAYILMAAGATQLFSDKVTEGGYSETSAMRVIEPIFDPARSPFIGTMLADMGQEAMAPKRMAKIATPEGLKRVHPAIGKMMDEMYGTTFIRVPAVADPFVLDPEGNAQELSEETVARLKALQQEYPDIGVVKEQRYYIPGGMWSLAFENSPLGELNSLLIRWEEEPLERADIRGEILRWARAAGGFDVALVSAEKAARTEEPKKTKETPGI